jgi:hypothetical protein
MEAPTEEQDRSLAATLRAGRVDKIGPSYRAPRTGGALLHESGVVENKRFSRSSG